MARDFAAERRVLETRFDVAGGALLLVGFGMSVVALTGDGAVARGAVLLGGWMLPAGLVGLALRIFLGRSEQSTWWLWSLTEFVVHGRVLTPGHKGVTELRGRVDKAEQRLTALEDAAGNEARRDAENQKLKALVAQLKALVAQLEERVARAEARVENAQNGIESAARRGSENVKKSVAEAERQIKAATSEIGLVTARLSDVEARAGTIEKRIPNAVAAELEAQRPSMVGAIIAEAKKKDAVLAAATSTYVEFVQNVAESFEQGQSGG